MSMQAETLYSGTVRSSSVMSSARKATAIAYVGVMLKVLVVLVVSYALDGTHLPKREPQKLFSVHAPFTQSADGYSLRPEVLDALIHLFRAHDLNVELVLWAETSEQAVAQSATLSQLLISQGTLFNGVPVVGRWGGGMGRNQLEALSAPSEGRGK